MGVCVCGGEGLAWGEGDEEGATLGSRVTEREGKILEGGARIRGTVAPYVPPSLSNRLKAATSLSDLEPCTSIRNAD
jgi:hypothetical protein